MPRKRGNTSPISGSTPSLPIDEERAAAYENNFTVLKNLTKDVTPDKVNSFNLPKSLITDVISPKKSAVPYSEKNGYIVKFNDPDSNKRCILCLICSRNCEYEELNRCSICPKYYHKRCRMNVLTLKTIHKHEFACPEHFAYSKSANNASHSPKRLSHFLHLEHPASGLTKSRQCISSRFRKAYLHLNKRKYTSSVKPQKRMQCLVPQTVKDLYEVPQYKIVDLQQSGLIAPIDPYFNSQLDLICQADKKTLTWTGRKSMVKTNETDLFLEAVMKLQGEDLPVTSSKDSEKSQSITSNNNSQNSHQDKPSDNGQSVDSIADNIQMNGHAESTTDPIQIRDTNEETGDIDVSTLDKRLLRMLAIDQLRIICPQLFHHQETISDPKVNSSSESPADDRSRLAISASSDPVCRALFTPLSYEAEPIKMMYSQFRIGSGDDCHLMLLDSADDPESVKPSCRYLSSHHLTIFRDKYSNEFELLNYGLIGTVVDDVLYTANVGIRRNTSQNLRNKKFERRSNFKTDLQEDLSSQPRKNHRMAALLDEERVVSGCKCVDELSIMKYSDTSLNQSALLTNGSIIQIGCVKLKFNICNAESHD